MSPCWECTEQTHKYFHREVNAEVLCWLFMWQIYSGKIAAESKNSFRRNLSKLELAHFCLKDAGNQLGYWAVKYVLISLVRLLSHSYLI